MFIEGILPAARNRLSIVADHAPLMDAAARLADAQINLVTVVDGAGKLAGVITKTDVVRQISRCQGSSCTIAASLVMTRDVAACQLGDQLSDVWRMMKDRGLKHLPVIDGEASPLGVLYARDALQVLLETVESEELLLRDYVLGIGYR